MACEPDSNYGSYCLSTVQSSSSSISMSLNESDLVEDQPSTSGCSSEQPYTKKLALRKSRKEQVKRYLKELKGLVVQPSGNLGTLSALQQVVDTFKQIKEEKELSSKLAKQENEFNLPFDEQNDLNSVCLNHEEALFFTLRYPDLNIGAVSKNITDVLGYPEPDYLVGRDICNFVHKKDIVTMNSSMSVHQEMRDEDGLSSSDNNEGEGRFQIQKKLFYFRLRKYKVLTGGFSLSSKETEFQTFQATVAQQPNVSDPTHKKKNKLSVVLKCVPMRSAYESEKLQNMTFSTRHSLFCSYSHIDSKAIPLLGFLPQDIVGMSIFDFYHPDDIELLYGIYQQVVNTETVPFESPPFRFRVRNGAWVYVKTEWSRFVNPWSHRLEFVIGQHTVIKGPTRKNIFGQMLNQNVNVNLSDNLARLKQMIRDLLLKPLVSVQIATPNQTIEKHRLNEEWTDPDGPVKEHSITYVDDSNASSSVSTNRETLSYDHLNYTSNIKRFLLSQKNTIYSPFSEKKSASSTEEEQHESSSCDSLLEVDISVPMPPSFGSSTKVLLSEQEREESGVAVFTLLDSDMATQPKNITTVPQSSRPNSPSYVMGKEVEPKVHVQQDKGMFSLMSLTQEMLWKHTRREETMFIEQAKDENNPMSFKLNGKRLHSLDPSSDNKWDIIKNIKIQKKQVDEKKKQKSYGKAVPQAPVGNSFSQPMFLPINRRMGVYQHLGMPFVQVDPVNIPIKLNIMTAPTDMMTSTPSTTSNNMQWPYYPQSVMGGFFQPGIGAFQPISKQNQNVPLLQPGNVPHPMPSTSSVGESQPLIHVPVPKKGGTVPQTQTFAATPMDLIRSSLSSSQSSSMEETSSSLLYMLEFGSPNRSFTSIEDVDKPKRVEAPSWLSGTHWSSPVCMRYTIPKKKLNKTLLEDREALGNLSQPDLLLSQMAMLEEELDQPPLLDMFEDDTFLMCPDTEIDDQMSANFEDQTDDSLNKTHVLEDTNLSTLFTKKAEMLDENIQNEQQKSVESYPGSDDRDSLIDDDSCYSKCSDMTPSDERSVEEADSSLKESDESDMGCTAKSFLSRIKHDVPLKLVDARFKKFFAPLPINFADPKKDGPPWMTNAVVNLYTKMKYCISPKSVERCLTEDRRKLQYMPQSDLVIEQLNSFIEDKEAPQFKGPGSILLKSSSQKQRNTYLRVPESLPVPHSGPTSESQRGRYSQIKHSVSTWQTPDSITETLVKYMFPIEPGSSSVPVIPVPSTVSASVSSAQTIISNKERPWHESMDL
ncbi:period circadian protein homolog 2-like isoform X2 [Mizuhopecten yessoensis]|uniref:period circadian protein homolog 2-like isoform X2 n=1 Tax=Mizuhopecten yessoensis TaxID=6573 RepID=UPI000B45763D|nr:period circadian protein homolog 2-like isoform X2 [Mizuhopecten yessoensis]